MKHRKEQWLIDCTDEAIQSSPDNHYTINTESKLPIAFVRMGGIDSIPFSIEEGESNAKLIAAAPELLSSIKSMLKSIDIEIEINGQNAMISPQIIEEYNNCIKTIKKATE